MRKIACPGMTSDALVFQYDITPSQVSPQELCSQQTFLLFCYLHAFV